MTITRVRTRGTRWLRGSGVALLILSSGVAGAVPLSQRPTTPGPHYFTYFASDMRRFGYPDGACQAGDYAPCIDDHANLAHIVAGDADFPTYCSDRGLPAYCDSTQMLDELRSRGMGAIFTISEGLSPNCANVGGHGQLQAGWTTWWSGPDGKSGYDNNVIKKYQDVIVGFYLWDEPETDDTILLDCIGQAAQQLRTEYPAIHRQVTFLASSLVPGSTNWHIPDGVDWIGYDHYTPPPGAFVPVGTGVYPVPYYVGRLKAQLEHSRPFFTDPNAPVGLVLFPVGWEQLPAASPDTSFAAQSAILTRADREIALAENDPDYVMIMPFIYQSGFDSAGSSSDQMVGVNEMPMVKTYYRGVGKHVTSTSAPMRPAFPTSIGASNQVPGGEVGNAFDFDPATAWNAGGYFTQWITASFADPLVITSFALTPAQSPAGTVDHVFSGTAIDGSLVSIGRYSGYLADSQTLTSSAASSGGLTSLTITTDASPSWVAWRSVNIQTTGSTRVYGYPSGTSDDHSTNHNVPQNATDADLTTYWTPPSAGPSLILDTAQVQTLSRIEVVVHQVSGAGSVTHTISTGSTTANLTVRGSSRVTTDGQKLVFSGPFPNTRYVKISAPAPALVAAGWREISLFR